MSNNLTIQTQIQAEHNVLDHVYDQLQSSEEINVSLCRAMILCVVSLTEKNRAHRQHMASFWNLELLETLSVSEDADPTIRTCAELLLEQVHAP